MDRVHLENSVSPPVGNTVWLHGMVPSGGSSSELWSECHDEPATNLGVVVVVRAHHLGVPDSTPGR